MVTTTWSKQAPPTTPWLKEGITQQGVGLPLCAGAESDPAYLVPNNPLTWTQVYTATGRLRWISLFGSKIVIYHKNSAQTNVPEIVHSGDGTTWTSVDITPANHQDQSLSPFSGENLQLRTSGVLSIGMLVFDPAAGTFYMVWESTDLLSFVKRYNQNFGSGTSSAWLALGESSTLYAFSSQDAGTLAFKDNGVNFVGITAPTVGGVASRVNAVVLAFGKLCVVARRGSDNQSRLMYYDVTGNTWTDIHNFGTADAPLGMAWWAERNELYLVNSRSATGVTAHKVTSLSGPATLAPFVDLIPGPSVGLDIKVVSRNLYILASTGGFARVYRSPDGFALYDLGATPSILGITTAGGQVISNTRMVYHPTTTRFYLVGAAAGIDPTTIWQSSVPS